LISLFFGLWKISDRYEFGWDQEDDAKKVMGMIEEKKPLLIGPRVSSEDGFFVGPYHYYYLLPFYGLNKGNPKSGIMAVTVINLATVISLYWVCRKLYGQKTAIGASLLMILAQKEIGWSAMYLGLVGVWGWWGVNKLLQSRKNIVWVLAFWGLASNLHLAPVSMGVPILAGFWLSNDKKFDKKELVRAMVGFLVFFLPLVVFEIRHDFLNIRKIVGMVWGEKITERENWLAVKVFWKSLSIFGLKWGREAEVWGERGMVLLGALRGIFLLKNKKEKIMASLWLINPLIAMMIYKGGVSEYYYSIAGVVIIILLARNLALMKGWGWLIVGIMIINGGANLMEEKSEISLKNKMELAGYLTSQKQDKVFNLSYELPLGLDNGFGYLFKYLGKTPKNVDEGHLYTIMLDRDEAKTGETVARSGALILKRR